MLPQYTVVHELTFQENCVLTTGNWFIDKFHLWCGIPLLWNIIYWLLVLLITVIISIKYRKGWKLLLLNLVVAMGLWFFFRIFLILLFVKEGLLYQNEIGEQIKYIFLQPISFFARF